MIASTRQIATALALLLIAPGHGVAAPPAPHHAQGARKSGDPQSEDAPTSQVRLSAILAALLPALWLMRRQPADMLKVFANER